MKRFVKAGLLVLFILSLSIPVLAAPPAHWERISPDTPNFYIDTNVILVTSDGNIAFTERRDFSPPFYKNRAIELELILYNPHTSMWRRFSHAYYDANYKELEHYIYSLQTTSWTKVSQNEIVIKRVMEILNNKTSAPIVQPTTTFENTGLNKNLVGATQGNSNDTPIGASDVNNQINNQDNTTSPNNTSEKRLGVSVHVSKNIDGEVAQRFRTAILSSYRDYLNPGFNIIEGDELDNALRNSPYVKNRNTSIYESEDDAITSLYAHHPLLIGEPRWQTVRGFNLSNLLLFHVGYLYEGNTINTNKYSITVSGVSFPKEHFEDTSNYHRYQGTVEEIVAAAFKDFLNRYDRSPGDALDLIIKHESEGGGYDRPTLVDTE